MNGCVPLPVLVTRKIEHFWGFCCSTKRKRERERQTEKERERETDREKERERDKQRDTSGHKCPIYGFPIFELKFNRSLSLGIIYY